jgi:hypothetical protein
MAWFLVRPMACAGLAGMHIFRQTWIAELDPATTDRSPQLTLSRASSAVKVVQPHQMVGLRRWLALGEMT